MKMRIIDVDKKIIEIRKTNVLLDTDVASLYNVQTREVNQAVKNNPDKFPKGYIITINKNEKNELVKNFDRKSQYVSCTAQSLYRKRFIYACLNT